MTTPLNDQIIDILKTRPPITRKGLLDALKSRQPDAYANHKNTEALNDLSKRLHTLKTKGTGVVQDGMYDGVLLWTFANPASQPVAAEPEGEPEVCRVRTAHRAEAEEEQPEAEAAWQPEPETTLPTADERHERLMREIFDRHAATFKAMQTYIDARLESQALTDRQRAALQTAVALLDVTDRMTGATHADELRGLLETA